MQRLKIISAPSILGLKPTGVERLPESLLSHGLRENLRVRHPVVNIPVDNSQYNFSRNNAANCLNPSAIREFSVALGKNVNDVMDQGYCPLVLGGDCSIIIGILAALKSRGTYGLVFCDAHADFYEPEKSVTGEVADMDLAIVTGRGPEELTNIHNAHPYICDNHVIHIGQRDWNETKKYGSQDIKGTAIMSFDFETIQRTGIRSILEKVEHAITNLEVDGFWLHFDTDVISDEENPAVDYRLAGGIPSAQCEILLKGLLSTNKIVGMTITIFNPQLDDEQGSVSKMLTNLITRAFEKYVTAAGNE